MTKAKEFAGWAITYKGKIRNVTCAPWKPVLPLAKRGWRIFPVIITEYPLRKTSASSDQKK